MVTLMRNCHRCPERTKQLEVLCWVSEAFVLSSFHFSNIFPKRDHTRLFLFWVTFVSNGSFAKCWLSTIVIQVFHLDEATYLACGKERLTWKYTSSVGLLESRIYFRTERCHRIKELLCQIILKQMKEEEMSFTWGGTQLVCCSPAGSMPYFGSMWPLLPSGGSKDFVLDKCNGGEAEFTKSSVHFNSLTPMWVSSVVLLFCFIALNCTVKAVGRDVFKTLKVHFMEY